jgi:ABC-type bacteriocin/lantibiotic exporter with double-glycine peptidase domain
MQHTRVAFSIENMSFGFDKKHPHFFANIDAHFPAHEMSFISGKNGSGKSTLLRILSGGVNKWEFITGSLMFPSKPFDKFPLSYSKREAIASCVKIVTQNFDNMIADQFNFIDNLRLANLPRRPGLGPLPGHKPIPEFIERFAIDFNKPVSLLSGGQRQILAILMALQKPAEVLLLDEPTAALDERNAMMVMEFLVEFLKTNKLTILVVCHDYLMIKLYAQDHYYFLDAPHSGSSRDVIVQNVKLRKVPVSKPLYTN